MKKKIFMFVVAIFCIIPCFMFVACNDNKVEQNPNNQETEQETEIVEPGLYRDGKLVQSWNELKRTSSGIVNDEIRSKSVSSADGYEYESYFTSLRGDLVIDPSITSISMYAFRNCLGLNSITISGVTRIGSYAFTGCGQLSELTVTDSGLVDIEDNAFIDCGLTNVTISGAVTNIGDNAFEDCISLTDVSISGETSSGKYLYDIGENAFAGCEKLNNVTISGAYHIGLGAFEGCNNLANITIPSSVVEIGAGAFDNCNNLIMVTFENTIGWSANGTSLDVTSPEKNAYDLRNADVIDGITWNRNS